MEIASLLYRVPSIVWLVGVPGCWFLYSLYVNQNKLLYHPVVPGMPFKTPRENPAPYDSPQSFGLQYEDVYLTAEDGVKLHGWFVPAVGRDRSTVATIVFFHGNAMNIGFRLPNVAVLCQDLGVNVFIIDYRGYGNSEGEPTEEGIQKDAVAVMAHVASRQDIHQGRVLLFGRSLGGAVALYAATSLPGLVAGVILENTFTSVSDMVDVVFPVLSYFKWAVLRIRWPSVELIPSVRVPVLFISGAKDQLVPSWMVQRLHDAATQSSHRELFSVPEGTHNDTFQKAGPEYVRRLRAFVLRACGPEALAERSPAPSGTAAAMPTSAAVAAAIVDEAPIGYQPRVGDALRPAEL